MLFSKQDLDTLSRTIYGEARGEFIKFGVAPLIAVANVILNRWRKKFAPTIHAVCKSPYQFSCWNPGDPNLQEITKVDQKSIIFRKCCEVAQKVLSEEWPDLTDGCDHYHARSIKPYWAIYKEPKRIFGSHFFYVLR